MFWKGGIVKKFCMKSEKIIFPSSYNISHNFESIRGRWSDIVGTISNAYPAPKTNNLLYQNNNKAVVVDKACFCPEALTSMITDQQVHVQSDVSRLIHSTGESSGVCSRLE